MNVVRRPGHPHETIHQRQQCTDGCIERDNVRREQSITSSGRGLLDFAGSTRLLQGQVPHNVCRTDQRQHPEQAKKPFKQRGRSRYQGRSKSRCREKRNSNKGHLLFVFHDDKFSSYYTNTALCISCLSAIITTPQDTGQVRRERNRTSHLPSMQVILEDR